MTMTKEARLLLAITVGACVVAVGVSLIQPFNMHQSFDTPLIKPVFGWITLALAVLSALYSLRKRELLQWSWPLKLWKAAHVWIGALFVVSMLIHAGGKIGGGVALALFVSAAGLVATGVWGIARQGVIPKIMTQTLQHPVYKSELQDDVNDILGDISEDLNHRTPAFERVFQRHILPAIAISRPNEKVQQSVFNRFDPTSQDPNAAVRDLDVVSNDEREIFYDMAEKTLDIIEFRRTQTYQKQMNKWLDWHIGWTALLLAAALFHTFASFYF